MYATQDVDKNFKTRNGIFEENVSHRINAVMLYYITKICDLADVHTI